ncbi:hypothetical protein KIPB_005695, partial [Kipferlia bialata]|eukprot:g5695.t1
MVKSGSGSRFRSILPDYSVELVP